MIMKKEFNPSIKLNRGFVCIALICSFSLFGCHNDKINEKKKTSLILISMDGFRWDYFDKTDTPNFDLLISGGVKSKALIPSFPSKTFPNHISIVTGRHPNKHGIIANRMYDPVYDENYYIGPGSVPVLDGKWYEAEPIWVTAEKQNQIAMTMFWPASEAEIFGHRPTEYFVYDGSVRRNARIDQILTWLDYKPSKQPVFISSYFSHLDDIGHRYGPDSDEVINAIKEMDRTIGRLINGLKSRDLFQKTNILLVSDHGMTATSKDSIIFLDDYIQMDNVDVVDWSPVAAIRPKGDANPIFNALENAHPKMAVYKNGELPERLQYHNHRRIQPIIAIADEHWSISTRKFFDDGDHGEGSSQATHGYDPIYESMGGVFVGHGPAFKVGFLGEGIKNIHLYEMMCKILGLSPAENDGSLDSTRVYLKD